MAKPKVAFYWCASCGGCEEAVVDLHEDILNVVEAVDIVFWPVAMDFKRKDVEAMEDGSIAVSFINGAVRTSEQEDMVRLLRRKSGLVVAFGSCAHMGGIPGLANFRTTEDIFEWTYKDSPSTANPEGTVPAARSQVPEGELELPEFYGWVKTLDQAIDVDYYLPGCAPPKDLILGAVTAILEGKLPPKGAVLAPDKCLCEDCARRDSKPDSLLIDSIRRPHEVKADPEKCFLEQGLLCMGIGTRSGCGQACINANMPCRGCFGPTSAVEDHGAKLMSAIGSLLDADEEGRARELARAIPDPAGTFYRFSQPAGLLSRLAAKKQTAA